MCVSSHFILVMGFASKQLTFELGMDGLCLTQPGALSPAEICEALDLHSLKTRKWHVQGTVATAGEGLYEGLDWLSSTLQSIQRSGGTTSVGGK